MSYLNLLHKHPKLLTYGGLHYFFSSIGQTFLISVFVPFILEDFRLSSSQFSSFYGMATVASAMILPFIGKFVDELPLKSLSTAGGLGLALATWTMYYSPTLSILIFGMFLLRLFGQGSMVLIGTTAIGRMFDSNRGKALSISSLGLALAESLLPGLMILLIGLIDWRMTWIGLGVASLVIFIPSSRFLVRGIKVKESADTFSAENYTDFSRSQILKEPKFYLLLIAFMFLPFFITGMFIHQGILAKAQNWSLEWMALSFSAYGIAKVITSFIGGSLIDRFSARRVFIFFLLPLAVGLTLMSLDHHKIIAFVFMSLLGISASLGSLTGTAIWAELYGVKNLGSIKSLTTTFMVLATAVGPIVIGWGLEKSDQITLIFAVCIILIITLTNFFILKKTPHQ